ncbi:MAG: M48 family metalloprotease, partial [Pyrinomonadaceae bacterium]
MYFLLATCLAFSLLLILNLVVSVSASVVWRVVSPATKHITARKRAQIIFALRTFPVGAASLFVLAFLLPAYFLFEPHSSNEVVSIKLALISAASLSGIGIAAFRVARTWAVTRRLASDWLARSEPIHIDEVNIPVYRLEHPFPVIAVVGIIRPRMFVASQIFDSLSHDEFCAAIAHEYGHLTGHDNFKRTFLRVCRDLLLLPFGRELDRAWAANTECAA